MKGKERQKKRRDKRARATKFREITKNKYF